MGMVAVSIHVKMLMMGLSVDVILSTQYIPMEGPALVRKHLNSSQLQNATFNVQSCFCPSNMGLTTEKWIQGLTDTSLFQV